MPHDRELLSVPQYLPLRDYQNQEGVHTLDLGAGRNFKRLRLDQKSFNALKLFLAPNTAENVANTISIPIEEISKFCSSLKKEGLLSPHREIPRDYDRYSRHLQYYGLCGLDPIAAQNKLSELTITLIGAGGIGNWMSLNLIGLGVKKLRLVDPDIIEESNLPRQILFGDDDIGKFKVDVVERELRKKASALELETLKSEVSEYNISKLIAGSHFVVLSADRPFFKIQKWTNQACINHKIPFLNVGYAAQEGVMGPLVVPGHSSCLACNQNLDENNYHLKHDAKESPFMKHFVAPSFVCLNSLISSMASYEIVKYFLDFGECVSLNHLVRINPWDFSIHRVPHPRDSSCNACIQ